MVAIIDVAGRRITGAIPVTTYPQSVYVTPDGLLAYVTFPFNDLIYVIDTLTNTVSRTLQVRNPYGVAFNSTGTRAYIAGTRISWRGYRFWIRRRIRRWLLIQSVWVQWMC